MKTKDFNSNVASRVMWLRKIKGYNSATVADALCIGQSNYIKIESGERRLTLENCAALAKFYGTTCDFIVNGTYETNAAMFTKTQLAMANKMLADIECLLSNTSDRLVMQDVKPTEVVSY